MPLDFKVESFFQPPINTASEWGANLRDGVANFACAFWKQFPGYLTRNTSPILGFERGFMNQMCSAVQTPVPPPVTPFIGGQCKEILYEVTIDFDRTFNGTTTNLVETLLAYGPIKSIQIEVNPPDIGPITYVVVRGQVGELVPTGVRSTPVGGVGFTAVINSIDIERRDGQLDNCGDPEPVYPPRIPTSQDRKTTVFIPNPDGVDTSVEIINYDYSNNYSFPMHFTVNGVVAVLDLGGLHFYSPNGGGDLDGGNDVEAPSSKGDDTKEYPIAPPIAPPLPIPRSTLDALEYILCTDGVIETISTLIPVPPGQLPLYRLIVSILSEIVSEICAEGEQFEIGLPEYYGLKPGVNRAAIVYYWREYKDNKWGRSTFTSTVHHPNQVAIDELETIDTQIKWTGPFKMSISLTDGGVIKATGRTEVDAEDNFDFLVARTNGTFLPNDIPANTLKGEDGRITVRELRLRQVEYYPDGKADNTSPSIRKLIKPPMSP